MARIYARLSLLVMGFYWIKVRDTRPKSFCFTSVSGLVVANHIGFVDSFVLSYLFAPSFVSKAGVRKIPVVGSMAKALQYIFVDRIDPNSRSWTLEMIKARADKQRGFPPLAVYSEGTSTNNKYVLQLQKGAFSAGQPITPISFRIPYYFFNHGWADLAAAGYGLRLLAQPVNFVEVTILPTYVPNLEEKQDAILYATNVQKIIAEASRLKVSALSLRESPHLGLGASSRAPKVKQVFANPTEEDVELLTQKLEKPEIDADATADPQPDVEFGETNVQQKLPGMMVE